MSLLPKAETMDAPIQGPLGLWPWPLLNTLIHITQNQTQPTPTSTPEGGSVLENKETVTWTDWRGEERTIRIEREVH